MKRNNHNNLVNCIYAYIAHNDGLREMNSVDVYRCLVKQCNAKNIIGSMTMSSDVTLYTLPLIFLNET